jgi:hypothetical protein
MDEPAGAKEFNTDYIVHPIVSKFDTERYGEVIRGKSGVGKTTLCSLQIGRLAKLTGRKVHLFVPKGKRFETVPKYQRWVPETQLIIEGTLYASEGFLRARSGSIFVVEDLAYYGKKNATPENARRLVVAMARAYDIFTVVITQSRGMHDAPLVVDVKKPRYQIHEGLHSVSDWYSFKDDSLESVDPLIGAVINGLPEREIGVAGRLVRSDSLRQRVFKALDAEMTTRQVTAAFPDENRKVIYEYIAQYRYMERQRKPNALATDRDYIGQEARMQNNHFT